MATQIAEAFGNPEKAAKLMQIYNKIAKFVRNRPRGIRYRRFPLRRQGDQTLKPSDVLRWKLFVFAGDGFGTLVKSHSAESRVVVLGDVIGRDGVAKFHGLLLGDRCAKIRRFCRSTLAAEAHSAVTAVGVALWPQVLMAELLFAHDFDYRRLTPPTEFLPMNPPHESPPDEDVRKEGKLNRVHNLLTCAHSPNPMMTDSAMTPQASCNYCKRP